MSSLVSAHLQCPQPYLILTSNNAHSSQRGHGWCSYGNAWKHPFYVQGHFGSLVLALAFLFFFSFKMSQLICRETTKGQMRSFERSIKTELACIATFAKADSNKCQASTHSCFRCKTCRERDSICPQILAQELPHCLAFVSKEI